MLRRLSLIILLFIGLPLLVLLGSWSYVANHEEQISQLVSEQLSATIGIPISLQSAQIGLHPTPTLDFRQISVDTNSSNVQIKIPQLHVGLDWHDLVRGKLIFSQLTIVSPDIYWQIQPQQSAPPASRPDATTSDPITPLREFLTKSSIRNGSLHIRDNRTAAQQTWQIEQLNLTVNDQLAEQSLYAQLQGILIQDSTSSAPFSTRIQLHNIDQGWQHTQLQLRAKVENFRLPAALQKQSPYQLLGAFNLEVESHGVLTTGLTCQLNLTPANHDLHIAGNTASAVRIYNAQASGQLSHNGDMFTLNNGQLKLNNIQIMANGSLDLSNNDTPVINAKLNSNTIALSEITPWLPTQYIEKISDYASRSTVRCKQLIIASRQWPLTLEAISDSLISFQTSDFSEAGISAKKLSGQLRYQYGKLSLKTSPLQFGSEDQAIRWTTPIQAQLSSHDKKNWDLELNLKQSAFNLANCLTKERGSDGQLRLSVAKDTLQWQIRNGELNIPTLQLAFSGDYTTPENYSLKVDIPEFELATISQNFKLLDWMKLRGKVAIQHQLDKKDGEELHSVGQVELHDCAISPTHVIAPIHHIKGTIHVDGLRAEAPQLNIGLGSSRMTVYGLIKDLKQPVAELHALGDNDGVISSDLVFNSDQALLHNLDGRIDIHKRGIDFVRASVELEQGTQATVTGKLLFAGPLLELDIDAPYANIDEIIALWSGDSNHGHPETISHNNNNKDPKENIHINARVDHGEISGFKFDSTSGTIHHRHGRLRIEPLRFEADAGHGVGTVIIRQEPKRSILEIEGTVVNIDADKVYSQLLKHTGLVTGRLFGNFTLQGPIGSEFLPQSQGTFHINLQKGVLRKFKVLSKAFSLLNVAQLFRFKLPDMAKEGMPFKRLTSDITLNNGTLLSDNLKIDSPAMNTSLAGELNLVSSRLNLLMGVKPLGTIDTLFSHIPIAGWLLTGDEQSVITAQFAISGLMGDPKVELLPISSVSDKIFGIFKRTLKLPTTLIKDPEKILINPERK